MKRNRPVMRAAALCLSVLALPAVAAAQSPGGLSLPPGLFASASESAQAGQPPVQATGPMQVERVENQFVIAPDFQVGKVAGKTAEFAGAYGGIIFSNRLLIGAAAYGLTNGSRTRGMAYGGMLVDWLEHYGNWVTVGLGGLVGGGTATLTTTVTRYAYNGPFDYGFNYMPSSPPVLQTFQALERRDFFIFQPHIDLRLKLARHLRLNWAVGYRAVAGAGSFDSQLRGASGSVGLEFSFGR